MTVKTEESTQTAELRFDGQAIELPVHEGSEGERAIDISKLRATTGLITLDPGYGNTGACTSSITFIDGEKGILRYRGYPIENLAEQSHVPRGLLPARLNGELPDTKSELSRVRPTRSRITRCCTRTSSGSSRRCRRSDAHPMAALAAAVGALSTFYPELPGPDRGPSRTSAANRLLAKMPTIAAYSYKRSLGSRSCTRATTWTTARTCCT